MSLDQANRTPAAIGLAAVAGVALGWSHLPLAFGVLTWAVLCLAIAIGFGDAVRRSRVAFSITGIFLLFSGLVAAVFWYDAPAGELRLWLGLPAATAILVYAIWPLGVLAGVLYVVEFERSILPADRLRRFRERYVLDNEAPAKDGRER